MTIYLNLYFTVYVSGFNPNLGFHYFFIVSSAQFIFFPLSVDLSNFSFYVLFLSQMPNVNMSP